MQANENRSGGCGMTKYTEYANFPGSKACHVAHNKAMTDLGFHLEEP